MLSLKNASNRYFQPGRSLKFLCSMSRDGACTFGALHVTASMDEQWLSASVAWESAAKTFYAHPCRGQTCFDSCLHCNETHVVEQIQEAQFCTQGTLRKSNLVGLSSILCRHRDSLRHFDSSETNVLLYSWGASNLLVRRRPRGGLVGHPRPCCSNATLS